jgi:predicted permease
MTTTTFDNLASDLRYVVRALLRSPLFTIVALFTLAIGSGASTAVFSVVNRVLLEPLPYPKSDDLVAVWQTAPGAGLGAVGGQLWTSASMYFTYAEHNRSFEHIGVWGSGRGSVTGLAEPEEVRNLTVSDGVLQALEVQPLLGRALTAADQEPGAARTAMLSYEYWQRRFGGDPAAVGRTITINSNAAEIIGVMPEGFRIVDTAMDVIQPLRFDRSRLLLAPFDFYGIARLKPGVSVADANADIERMLPIWQSTWPPFRGTQASFYSDVWKIGPGLRPLKQEVVGGVGNVLWIVMGTIAIVLLIACANVANLLLVRARARERELAVRAALGAGGWHIARVLLLESTVLGALGGIAGLAVAYAALQVLLAIGPTGLPRLSEITIGGRELAFSFGISLLAGLLLGLVPVLKHAGPRTSAALHVGGRGSSAGRERNRAQNVLVVGQVALALVLLVTAGLMVRTFDALRRVEPGFTNAAELQTLRIAIPTSLVPEPERVARTQNDILGALAAIPGVRSAAFTSSMPMDGFNGGFDVILAEGQEVQEGTVPPVRRFKSVSPGLLETAGTRLVAGRDFVWDDLYDLRPVVMVSENLARELWNEPAGALGKRIGFPGNWREVVGVVQDVRDNGLDQAPPAIVYWPSLRMGAGDAAALAAGDAAAPALVARAVTVVVRTPLAGTPVFTQQVQRAVWSVNPNLPVASVRTMQEVQAQSLARTSFTLVMLAAAGGVALVLGVVGLYGVISYAVAQRRREIAIRMALGAQQSAIRARFVRYGVTLAAIGILIGLGAAALGTRLMTSLLYEVRPLDLPTYVTVGVALTLVAAIASYLPARRASRVDPAESLAAE